MCFVLCAAVLAYAVVGAVLLWAKLPPPALALRLA